MYTQSYRPKTFDDILGQDIVKKILKAVVKHPGRTPSKSFIFEGDFGIGKTVTARVFARALNKVDENIDIVGTRAYEELDSAVVGNVEFMRKIRDHMYTRDLKHEYRIYVFDEVQMASSASQSVLLRVIEDIKGRVFFIFCTTEKDKIIETLRSRSVELHFDPLEESDIKRGLVHIIQEEEIGFDEKIIDLIIRRSNGHYRNALIYLENYVLMGREGFLEYMIDSLYVLGSYFRGVFDGKEDISILDTIISKALVSYIMLDLEKFMYHFIRRGVFGQNKMYDSLGKNKVLAMFSFYVNNKGSVNSSNDLRSFLILLGRFFKRERIREDSRNDSRFTKREGH